MINFSSIIIKIIIYIKYFRVLSINIIVWLTVIEFILILKIPNKLRQHNFEALSSLNQDAVTMRFIVLIAMEISLWLLSLMLEHILLIDEWMLWWTITGHQYFLLSHYWRIIFLIRACKTSDIVSLSEKTSATFSLYELKIRLSESVWIDRGLKLNSIPLVEWVLIGHNYLPRFPLFLIDCGYICPYVINNSIRILWSTITNVILRLISLRCLFLHRCLVVSVSDH